MDSGSKPGADATSLAAALADRYTIEREIGRGGMATVFRATELRLGRLVASAPGFDPLSMRQHA